MKNAVMLSMVLAACGGASAENTAAVATGDAAELVVIDGGTREDLSPAKTDMAKPAADMTNVPDLAEPTCGVAGKPCCGGVTSPDGGANRDGTCDEISACYPFSTGSLCKPCGGDNEICCSGTTACSVTGEVCRPADPTHGVDAPTCYPCGGVGQKECAGQPSLPCWGPGSTPNPEGICQ